MILRVGNINTRIEGDISYHLRGRLFKLLSYTTKAFNGFAFVEVTHNLFDKVNQTFPTGLYSIVTQIFDEEQIDYETIDIRKQAVPNKPLPLYGIELRKYQEDIVRDAVNQQRFVIQVATGGGKTVIAGAILASLNVPSLFIVHTGDLFEQAYDDLSEMLKVPIGKIGGGECKIEQINVCMIQTIHAVLKKKYEVFDEVEEELSKEDELVKKSYQVRDNSIKKFIESDVQCILIDECHHISANSYIEAMKACKAALWRGGLSATPYSGEEKDIILQAYAGKSVGNITASYLIKQGFLVKPKIFYLLGSLNGDYKYSRKRYNLIYKKNIVGSVYRNNLIVDCVKRLKELNKSVLITVTTKKHGKVILELLKKKTNVSVEFIYSNVDKILRKQYIQKVRDRQLDVIVGTSLADEGLNIPALDALILAGGGKSPTRQIQRIGRTLRKSPGKTEAIIIDFKDCYRYLLGHYKKRRNICEAESEFEIVNSF